MRAPIQNFRGHVVVAVLAIAAAAAIMIGFLAMGGGASLGGGYRVDAIVPTAASLSPSARVTMAGVTVGRVRRVARHGAGTEIEMNLTDDRVTPLPADSRVVVRQHTPVGESYVALVPGTAARTLPSGSALPMSQADEFVDVDQILSVLRGPTRDRARALFQGLGGAIDGRGEELNGVLRGSASTLDAGARFFRTLSADREHVARLVDRLGRVAGAVSERGASVEALAQEGLVSLDAVASRDAALRATLDALPGTLRQVQSSSERLSRVSRTATPVLADVAVALREVRPGVRRLQPASRTGRDVVGALDAAAPKLTTTLDRVRTLSGPLARALPQVRRTLCEVNPVIRYLKPYTDDAVMSLVGLGSASNSYDAIGHLIRLSPIVGENSLAGAPAGVQTAAYTLLRAGLLSKSHGLTWNPYPEPDRIGKDQAGPGNLISGPEALGKSGYRFPHVLADC